MRSENLEVGSEKWELKIPNIVGAVSLPRLKNYEIFNVLGQRTSPLPPSKEGGISGFLPLGEGGLRGIDTGRWKKGIYFIYLKDKTFKIIKVR